MDRVHLHRATARSRVVVASPARIFSRKDGAAGGALDFVADMSDDVASDACSLHSFALLRATTIPETGGVLLPAREAMESE